jgi:autotransporter-associated beta strand protein
MRVRCPRGRLWPLAVCTLLTIARPALAQTYTWVAQTSGNWSDPANWLTPPGVPVSGSGTVVEFDLAGVSKTGFTATQDIASNFQLNQFVFNVAGVGPTVATAAGGQPIALVASGSAPPTILVNNTGSVSFNTGALTLGAGTVFGGGGTGAVILRQPTVGGSLAFTGNGLVYVYGPMALPGSGDVALTGNGRSTVGLPFSGIADRLIVDFGPGTLGLGDRTSTYTVTNGIELRSGTLVLGSAGAATNVLVVKGGAVSSSGTLPNPIRLDGADLVLVPGGSGLTLQGPITTSSGTPGLTAATGGTVTLLNAADYPGPTVVGPPTGGATTLTLDSNPSAGTHGRLTGTSSVTVNNGSTLALTNAAAVNNSRLPAIPVTLNAGALSYTPGAGAANGQTFGDLIVNGHGTLAVPASTNPATTTVLQFGALTRGSTGTLTVVGPVSGGPPSAAAAQVTFAAPLASLADPLGAGPTDLPVIPFVSGDSTASSSSPYPYLTRPRDLYTPDGNGLRALTAAELDAVAAGGALVPHTNNLLNGSPAPLAAGATVRVNALRASAPVTIAGGPGSTLQVYSGAVVANGHLDVGVSTLDFANHTGYLHVGDISYINASITGTAGLAVEGSVVRFTTTNPFTGGLSVNGNGVSISGIAAVQYSADDQLGAAGGGITLGGGTLTYLGSGPLTLRRPLTVTAAGGVLNGVGPLTLDLTGSTGPGSLTLEGDTFQLTGTAGYAGSTVVRGGAIVRFTGDQNFGAGPVALRGTLQFLSNGPFGKAIVAAGTPYIDAPAIDTNGFSPTYTGTIQCVASPLTKKGAGTLTITGPQSLTGDVLVSAGGLTLAGNGRFDNLASLHVAAGATVTLDDSAGNVAGRLPAQVTLQGGELVVRGNPAGAGEAIGTLALSGRANSVVSLRPAAGAAVALTASGLDVRSSGNPLGGTLLLRGPNLGGTGPDSSRLTFASPLATARRPHPGRGRRPRPGCRRRQLPGPLRPRPGRRPGQPGRGHPGHPEHRPDRHAADRRPPRDDDRHP